MPWLLMFNLHTMLLLGQIVVLLSDVVGHYYALIITANVLLLLIRVIIMRVPRGALPATTVRYLD